MLCNGTGNAQESPHHRYYGEERCPPDGHMSVTALQTSHHSNVAMDTERTTGKPFKGTRSNRERATRDLISPLSPPQFCSLKCEAWEAQLNHLHFKRRQLFTSIQKDLLPQLFKGVNMQRSGKQGHLRMQRRETTFPDVQTLLQ